MPAAIERTRGRLPPRPRLSTAFATSFGLTHRITRSAPAAASAFAVVHVTDNSAATLSALAFVRAVARICFGFTRPDLRRPEAMVRPIVPDPMIAMRFVASMKPPPARLVHPNHRKIKGQRAKYARIPTDSPMEVENDETTSHTTCDARAPHRGPERLSPARPDRKSVV